MTGAAFDRVLDALRAAGRPVTMDGPNRARSSCPAHDGDNRTALSVVDTADRVNLHCFTRECDGADVLAALGLSIRDRYHEPRGDTLARYQYPGGFTVTRTMGTDGKGKGFTASPGWAGRPRPLYRGDRVAAAVAAGRPVLLVEGEEDVHAVEAAAPDAVAVSAPHGAASFAQVDPEPLRGATVVAVVDRDAAGDRWAADVRAKLDGVALVVRFVRAASGKDASDHLAAGRTLAELEDYPGPEVGSDFPPEPESLDEPDAPEDAPRARASTWARVDLSETVRGLLAGTLSRPAPTVGAIRGGSALFYPGRVNGLAGESGAGKTWTALHIAAQAIAAGACVLYVDHEDDHIGIVGRLLDLGADPGAVAALFIYTNPTERPAPGDLAALAALVAETRPVLVVVDSTGEGLALHGANPNADEEVAAWFLEVPRRLAAVSYDGQPGPAVLVLDHVTKTDDGGLWPIGSQRKRAAISGAQYMQRTVRPFSKDAAGAAVLVCAKDRHGNYRTGQRVAELNVAPGASGPSITLDAVESGAASSPFRPTGYMERVSVALEAAAPEPLSHRGIEHHVTGKKDVTARAVAALVAEGYVTTTRGPRNATLHTLVKPFRESADRGGTVSTETTPETTVDRPPSLETGTGGQSLTSPRGTVGDGGGRSADDDHPPATGTGRVCADCGVPCAVNRVRCPECLRVLNGGVQ